MNKGVIVDWPIKHFACSRWCASLTNFDDIVSNFNITEVTQLYLRELIMHLSLAVLFKQRPYLRKIQLNHTFQGRFVQISSKFWITIIHLLDKSHQFGVLVRNFVTNQLRPEKINYFALNFINLWVIVKAPGKK